MTIGILRKNVAKDRAKLETCNECPGGKFGLRIAFFGTIFSLKIGVLLGKYFRMQTKS